MDIHGPHGMNPNNWVHPLIFPLMLGWGEGMVLFMPMKTVRSCQSATVPARAVFTSRQDLCSEPLEKHQGHAP